MLSPPPSLAAIAPSKQSIVLPLVNPPALRAKGKPLDMKLEGFRISFPTTFSAGH